MMKSNSINILLKKRYSRFFTYYMYFMYFTGLIFQHPVDLHFKLPITGSEPINQQLTEVYIMVKLSIMKSFILYI
jgi:hypothetical protein